MGKSWMKGRQDRVKRIQPEYHLIVTEGTKTEPAYFEAIKNEINRRHPQKIQLQIGHFWRGGAYARIVYNGAETG